eukprot:15440666-Alexandrium_andersonii.AAC.1
MASFKALRSRVTGAKSEPKGKDRGKGKTKGPRSLPKLPSEKPTSLAPESVAATKPAPGRLASVAAQRKPRCLHLLSGPALRKDGLSAVLRFAGWEVDDVDI